MRPDELQAWFANVRTVLETAYVANDEPWKQSGMSGPPNAGRLYANPSPTV